ncbi:restriction endonuclease (plasmid) [Klebsiella pneumoniae]|uniref:restriction endonuclease n=1 Tax=Klebsiella pneumoniae TaxID=573 RepID=UPI001FAD9C1E|nr:restriction endonuclease [Klebsiella pneumoniae]MCI8109153.1 restriction endonuclease [Klebsiella pneumoniae]
MGRKNQKVVAKPVSGEKVMRQRFFGMSGLVIALNIVFADNIRVQLLTLCLMLMTTLLLTPAGRVLVGTWANKEKWRTLNVPQKTVFFKFYVAIPVIAIALIIHTATYSRVVTDGVMSYVFPVSEDISDSVMLTKLRGIMDTKLPNIFSSIALYFAYLFGIGSIVKNMQIGMSEKMIKRIRNSADARRVLEQMTWDQFEKILRKFFESKGYKAALTNTGADGGVDVALEKNGRKEMVQAKHWKVNRVGVSVVREIYGVVQAERMHRGFIVTSGLFTEEAREFADKVSGKVVLIDGNLLIEIIKGDSEFEKQTDATINSAEPIEEKTCSVCSSKMILRTVNKRTFWGCSNYPECRNTHEI